MGIPTLTYAHKKLFKGELFADEKCHIHRDVRIDLASNVYIAEYAEVGAETMILTHQHKWNHSRGRRGKIQKIIPVELHIERDVFIGVRSLIIGVETIGAGAIIGACSVITKNIPALEIWAGNPAKKIGERK